MPLGQKLIPGIVGISTYVDFAYQRHMQLAAVEAAGTEGPINQLRTITVTLDFNQLIQNLQASRRHAAEEQVASVVEALAAAGADFIVVTSGTTSTLTDTARRRIALPFLDLAAACFTPQPPPSPIGLLATTYAAKGGLFQAAGKPFGAKIVTPRPATAARVDQVIFGELVRGAASDASVGVFRCAIDEFVKAGAKSVILGNTDLTLIAEKLQETSAVPLIDSTTAHGRAAARAALTGEL